MKYQASIELNGIKVKLSVEIDAETFLPFGDDFEPSDDVCPPMLAELNQQLLDVRDTVAANLAQAHLLKMTQ